MKRTFLIFAILSIPLTIMAQATQPCVVKQYNGKQAKTPLAGVRVHVDGAQTATSAADGRFTLTFHTLKPGDHVRNTSAMKPGYEIFNMSAVEQWNISRSNTPFTLVLVKSEEFKQLKGKLTQTSTDTYRAKYEQAVRELEKLKEQGKLKEEEYEKKYDELDANYREQLATLDNYIDQFARIDLSELSEQEQRIIEMMQEGKVEEALKAYAELGLIEKFGSEAETYLAEGEAVRKLQDDMENRKSTIDQLYEAAQREVSALILAEKKKEAEQKLISLLEKLTPLFEQAPDEFRPMIAKVHSQLGKVTSSKSIAIEHLSDAVNEYTILVELNPETYLPELSNAQYLLGDALSFNKTKAEEYLLAAERNFTKLFQKDPNKYCYRLACAKLVLGTYSNYIPKKEQLFHEVIDLVSPANEQNHLKFHIILYTAYEFLARLYWDLKSFTDAEEAYLNALDNARKMALLDIRGYGDNLYKMQISIFHFYSRNKKVQASDFIQKESQFYIEQIDSLSFLFRQNPNQYGDMLAIAQDNFVSFYSFFNSSSIYNIKLYNYIDIDSIEKHFQIVLDNYIKLYHFNPEKYGEIFAKNQEEIGSFYLRQLNNSTKGHLLWEEVEKVYLKLLDIFSSRYQQDSIKYGKDLAHIQENLGHYYFHSSDNNKAEKYFLNAEKMYEHLTELDHEQYSNYLINVLEDLIFFYKFNDKTKVEKYYLKEEETLIQLSKLDFERYGYALADIQRKIADYYLFDFEDFAKAKDYFNKAHVTYTLLLQKFPEDDHILFELDWINPWLHPENDDNNGANDALDAAMDAAADAVEKIDYNVQAYEYAKSKDFSLALEIIEEAISLMPEEAEYYNTKGEILLMKGDEQRAVEMWQKVMELDPDFLSEHNGETELHRQIKKRGLIEK